jgi:hypothetical protein
MRLTEIAARLRQVASRIEVVAKHSDVDIPDELIPKMATGRFVDGRIWDGFKSVLLVTALFSPIVAETQKPPTRVALSSTSTIDLSELRQAFHEKCPSVVLNRDPSRADYALEAIRRTTNPATAGEVSRYRFTLFNRGGNTIYSTSPYKFSNAINNVCSALVQHTDKATAPPIEKPD